MSGLPNNGDASKIWVQVWVRTENSWRNEYNDNSFYAGCPKLCSTHVDYTKTTLPYINIEDSQTGCIKLKAGQKIMAWAEKEWYWREWYWRYRPQSLCQTRKLMGYHIPMPIQQGFYNFNVERRGIHSDYHRPHGKISIWVVP